MTGRSSSGGGSMLPVSCSCPRRVVPVSCSCLRIPAASPCRYRMSGAARQVVWEFRPMNSGVSRSVADLLIFNRWSDDGAEMKKFLKSSTPEWHTNFVQLCHRNPLPTPLGR